MMRHDLTRRQFARGAVAGLGAALIANEFFVSEAEARRPYGVPKDVIQLNSNENPHGPSQRALQAMTRAQRSAARYPDALETEMAEAVARLHGVEPDNVLLGCGSGEILRMAAMAFLAPGKNVVVSEPTFEAVLDYSKVPRAESIKVPQTSDFRHDLPRMAAAASSQTGLVYVCNPNNPTGTIVTRDELADFIERVPRTALILVDEAYFHFVEDTRYASAFDWFKNVPNLILVRTFSKVYGMAGMRLGYAVASAENTAAMREHRIWNNTNAAVLEAGLASLEDTGHVQRHRKLNDDTRRWLCRELDREGRRYIPSETNFVMIDVEQDVVPIIAEFRNRKMLVGRKFPSMGNWLRISIGTRKEMEAFLAGLRTIVPVAKEKAA